MTVRLVFGRGLRRRARVERTAIDSVHVGDPHVERGVARLERSARLADHDQRIADLDLRVPYCAVRVAVTLQLRRAECALDERQERVGISDDEVRCDGWIGSRFSHASIVSKGARWRL